MQACRERARWPAAGRIIPAGPPAQRLPGEPDQLIGTGRQSRRGRPGSQHRPGDRELSHFLAAAVHREFGPLAAGTNAEVVDLVGAAVVLEGGDGRAAAGVVFRGPQGQAFLALAPARLRDGGHRSVLSRPDQRPPGLAPVQVDLIHRGGHSVVRLDAAERPFRAVLAPVCNPRHRAGRALQVGGRTPRSDTFHPSQKDGYVHVSPGRPGAPLRTNAIGAKCLPGNSTSRHRAAAGDGRAEHP